MDSQNSKINVLVIGAFGKLGLAVTRRCLEQPNLAVSILVRDPQKNKELADKVTQAGGRVIKGDVTQPETIKGTTKGMHTVIMTFDNIDAKVAVDGQIIVIKDSLENGVERVVPAEYSTDPTKFSAKELQSNSVVGNKIKVQEYLKTVPIKHLNINTGIILDWFLDAVIKGGFDYWGDVNTKMQLTSYDDTAKVLAAAVAQKDRTGDIVFVSDDVTTPELTEIYNRVRGTTLKARHLGTLSDLHAKVAELEKEGKHEEAFWLSLTVFIYDDRTRFDKTNNDEFKNVKTTSIEEFFRQNPNVVIGA